MVNAKPNIVFILTDDQQRLSLGALGNREIRTPNIDRLVADGTVFTQAAIMGGTCGAVCMPSRAMLMTGRTLFHLDGLGRNIPAEHKTLPETFRAAGYHTCHVGKWHQDRASFHRGYDAAARIFGFTPGWYKDYGGHWNVPIHDFDPSGTYPEDDGYILAEDGETPLPVEPGVGGIHSTDMFGEAAVATIRNQAANSTRPLFLYLGFVAPHDPRQSPNRWLEAYPPADISVPDNVLPRHPFDNGELLVRDECLEAWPRQPEAVHRHIADYYAMIAHARSTRRARRAFQADRIQRQWRPNDAVVRSPRRSGRNAQSGRGGGPPAGTGPVARRDAGVA